jgi:biotin synthase
MSPTSWNEDNINQLFSLPFFALIQQAYQCHQCHFSDQSIEFCTLSSIKTGACPEDCAYCPQSAHYQTGLKKEKLIALEEVVAQAKAAKAQGAQRFCMGAAWRNPPKKEFPQVLAMIRAVKALGLETCVTLGQLDAEQAQQLHEAGLDFYNHNLDSSPEFYQTIIHTRTYADRLNTLDHVAKSGIAICCGGILGMGETQTDRVKWLLALSQLPAVPRSIPINQLIPIAGTPLANAVPLDSFDLIKTIAVTRLIFPQTRIRLAAGREKMTDETQAWCFMAGANSIFIGEKLLTANNATLNHDQQLLQKLNLVGMLSQEVHTSCS